MADNKKSSISKRSSCYLLNLKAPEKTARRLKLSFQRTAATVTVLKAERHVEAVVGFLDVSETGAGIFTPELLNKGSYVELSITEPAPLKVRGIVAWSVPVTSGIHDGRFRCRSGIQFVLEGEAQTQAVQEFVKKAGQDPIENFRSAMAAAAKQAEAVAPLDAPVVAPEPSPVPSMLDAMTPTPSVPAPEASTMPPPVADAAPPPVAEAPAPVADAPSPVAEAAPAEAAAAAPAEGAPDSGQKAA